MTYGVLAIKTVRYSQFGMDAHSNVSKDAGEPIFQFHNWVYFFLLKRVLVIEL